MGCFPACFGTPKRQKHRKLANETTSTDQSLEANEAFQPTALPNQEDIENPVNPSTESDARKKVCFDLNVKNYEEPSTNEVATTLLGNNEEKENEKQEETSKESKPFSGLIASSILSSPPKHRCQNCADCDLDNDDDEVGDVHSPVQEESSDSLFSLSIDSRKHVGATETGEKEVNSPMPEVKTIGSNPIERSESVDLVLKPIENLTPWKTVQAKKTTPLENQAKENIPADTSLSSWLVESEFTPKSKNSSDSVGNLPAEKENSRRNVEDRAILGALTVTELKQFSASASPKWSRSRSPDEKLVIGTVGSYWRHTGQTMDSDSGSSCREMNKTSTRNREDERVKWNSSPFEARMERALSEV
ncbi:uncharacterized protein LOC132170878 [Corylus avellana]|uniref:uncharacterized protein LOC132170878 n=1 Tax=Corylus avellana TaxID=13451 RepID=UPI00286D4ED7|nr:uncharacterized protein LOC132170878 [Corylus avellana]